MGPGNCMSASTGDIIGMTAATLFAVLFMAPVVVLCIRLCQAIWRDLRP